MYEVNVIIVEVQFSSVLHSVYAYVIICMFACMSARMYIIVHVFEPY